MIGAGLILEALGWQAIGVGMVAKGKYDSYKNNKELSRQRNHYAPITEWWSKYGVCESECDRLLTAYSRSIGHIDGPAVKDEVLGRLREKIKTDDRYVNWLLSGNGTDLTSRMRVCALYYASKGRAARYGVTADSRFPMAGFFDAKPGLKKVAIQLLKDSGVPDTHWFCESISEQESRLN